MFSLLHLETLNLDRNLSTGCLSLPANITNQSTLAFFVISSKLLSGQLPSSLLTSLPLVSCAANDNCIYLAEIPEACLALIGVGVNGNCKARNTATARRMPLCLRTMSNLSSLYISNNGLTSKQSFRIFSL